MVWGTDEASPSGAALVGETVTLMQYDLAKKYFELVGEPIDFEGNRVKADDFKLPKML